ncbi:4Fe-4S dicluster domain-containing protein [Deinococcus multiflagellatus]|uniref:4Fe-4S dicluster domain-containing protein n=1 Tax=Deinococcus multiflagellatus TaxID=1656887 RepID=A0ABW1ZQH7_9DEIO
MCANVCPTGAIDRDLQPDGGVHLLLNLSACTGCMACLQSCPPGHPRPDPLAPGRLPRAAAAAGERFGDVGVWEVGCGK